MELLLSNPLLTITIAVVCVLIGKYFWVSKDEEKVIAKDLSGISQKIDTEIGRTKEDFLKELHAMEIAFSEKQGNQLEKLRIVQNEIMEKIDKKYFTKEMAEKHNERINKMEEVINAILPRLEKIDVMYDVFSKKNQF